MVIFLRLTSLASVGDLLLPVCGEFHVPWARPGPELGKISGAFIFCHPALVGGWVGGRGTVLGKSVGECLCA
jgi:hypothetical protein